MPKKSNPRVPRKKGQHRGSSSHSDLYTDENPKGTIKGLKFATVKDAKASVAKIRSSGKSHAHKVQAAVAMEQRAKEMGKSAQAGVYRAFINKMKKKTKKKNENVAPNHDGKAAPYGSGYKKVEEDKWSQKYKKSIDCSNPKGFSQKAHCAGKKKKQESVMSLEEKLNLFLEKNVPTDKSKWAYYKSQAKKKFDVYPSAYANAWAAKKYKAAGGGWRKTKGESIEEARGTCWVGYQQKGMKKKGDKMVPNCVKEIYDVYYESNGKGKGYTFEFITDTSLTEAEYQGRKVKLNKIMQGDKKKFKVYVKNDKGNVVVVHFGQGGDAKGGTMRIRKSNPEARKSFRARHNCDTPGPKWKARYWSCRKW